MRNSLSNLLSNSEAFLAFIQGKGSGAGWDLKGEIQIAISNIHRDNANIFDVGANFGEWSIRLIDKWKSENGRLFQIEPAPYCQKALSSLNLPRTTLICAAVGEKSKTAKFYSPDDWSPIGSLYKRRDSYLDQYDFREFEVQVMTIDEIIDEHKIDFIDYMKLDVEGHEYSSLLGCMESLESKRIRALTFEFGSCNINSRIFFHDFWDLLTRYEYRIFRICPGGVLYPIDYYYEDLEYFRSVTNYLCLS
jgi:FkbM family methyltransferase